MGEGKPILRRLGEAAVVFDPATWQTHVLPPAAAVVADIIGELSVTGLVSTDRLAEAMRDELDVDPDAPAMRELLRMLREIGMLGE